MKYLMPIIAYFLFNQTNYSIQECKFYENLSLEDSKGIYLLGIDGKDYITTISVCFDSSYPRGIGFVLIDYNGGFSNVPSEITRISNFGDIAEFYFTFTDMRMKLITSNKMRTIRLENLSTKSYKLYRFRSAEELLAQRRKNIAIVNEKIEKYKTTSQDLSLTDKLEQLDKLISSLNNKYPVLENERKKVIEGIFNEGIEKPLKNNDYKTARKFFSEALDTYPKSLDVDKLEEFRLKIFPHIDIINRIYADMFSYDEYEPWSHEDRMFSLRPLLWMLTYSTIEFVDFKWYKQKAGVAKLILIGSDGKLYGGKKDWYKTGIWFSVLKSIHGVRTLSDDSIINNLPKIKNREVNEVPTIPNEGPSYISNKTEYLSFQKMIDSLPKTNNGWPKYDFKIRYNF